jgi:hypothetical protein
MSDLRLAVLAVRSANLIGLFRPETIVARQFTLNQQVAPGRRKEDGSAVKGTNLARTNRGRIADEW